MANLFSLGYQGLSIRFLLVRWWRSGLAIAGVALGTALLLAALTLNATLQAGLLAQVRSQYGTFDLLIVPEDVAHQTIAADTVNDIAAMADVRYVVPNIVLPAQGADSPVAFYTAMGEYPSPELAPSLLRGRAPGPDEVALPVDLAERLGAAIGDSVSLPFPGGSRSLQLVGLMRTSSPTAWFDFNWLAREMGLASPNALMVGVQPGVSKHRLAAQVQSRFPHLNIDLRTQLDRARNALSGYGLLGTILGGASLLVSLLLVSSAFGISVQERTRELAMLRAIGAQPRQVTGVVLWEAVLIGLAGAVFGTVLGLLAAWMLMGLAGRILPSPPAFLTPWPILAGTAGLAMVVTLAGAWQAARQAGRSSPLGAIRHLTSDDPTKPTGRWWVPAGFFLAWATLTLTAVWLGLSARTVATAQVAVQAQLRMTQLSLVATACLLVAVISSLPGLIPWCGRWLSLVIARRWPAWALIGQHSLARHRYRVARATATLTAGLALLIFLGYTVNSEARQHMETTQRRFPTQAQLYAPLGSAAGFGEALVREVKSTPGVTGLITSGREVEADLVDYDVARMSPLWAEILHANGVTPGRVLLQPVDHTALGAIFPFGEIRGRLTGGIVMTSQLADLMGLQLGETLQLRPAGGSEVRSIPVAGIVDQLPEGELAMTIDPGLAEGWLYADRLYRVGYVMLAPDADAAGVKAAVLNLLRGRYAAFTYENRADALSRQEQRRRESMFMVTGAGAVTLLITFVGLLNLIMSSVNERRHELGIVRALGTSPGQACMLVTLESTLVGASGSLLGLLTGALMVITMYHPTLRAGALFPDMVPLLLITVVSGPALATIAGVLGARRILKAPIPSMLAHQ